MKMKKNHLRINELALLLGISNSKAQKIIRSLNKEMERSGYITVAGRVPLPLLRERMPYEDLSDERIKALEEARI